MPMKYDKLFALMKNRNITTYNIRKDKVIGVTTLLKLQKNEGHIDTRSLEKLCEYLHCQPGDLMEYIPENSGGQGF